MELMTEREKGNDHVMLLKVVDMHKSIFVLPSLFYLGISLLQ